MFTNNLKIAWRTLSKNKLYTAINVLGLTVGIAAVLLIYRIVSFELSFNKNFQHYDRIVRVVSYEKTGEGVENHSVCVPIPAMDAMQGTVSQFEKMGRVKELWATLTIPNPAGGAPLKKFSTAPEEIAFFTEPAFSEIFSFPWLAGDPETALSEPSSIVLSRSWAVKCFDRWEDATGQTVMLDNVIPVTVRGVVEDLPDNCDFTFPFLVSYPTLKSNSDYFFYDEDWGSNSHFRKIKIIA